MQKGRNLFFFARKYVSQLSTVKRNGVDDRRKESVERHRSYCSLMTFLTVITVIPNARPPFQKNKNLGTSFCPSWITIRSVILSTEWQVSSREHDALLLSKKQSRKNDSDVDLGSAICHLHQDGILIGILRRKLFRIISCYSKFQSSVISTWSEIIFKHQFSIYIRI